MKTIPRSMQQMNVRKCLSVIMALGASLFMAQAQPAPTVTQTYHFAAGPAGTLIRAGSSHFIPWIEKGSLPAGSILRKVTANITIQSATADSWASDFLIYFDGNPIAPTTAAVLQLGGNYSGNVGTVAARSDWSGGDNGPVSGFNNIRTAGIHWTNPIDLHNVKVSFGNNYADANFSGSVTLEYDATELAVSLTEPSDQQQFPTGSLITATATVADPGNFAHTVTFHVTPTNPPGTPLQVISGNAESPFTADLGFLPAGEYEMYATVINDNDPVGTATSATRTFTVADAMPTITVVSASANPTTYGSGTLTASISPIPAGGTVQFYADSVPFGGSIAVDTITGQVQRSISTLPAGTHEITAEFSGFGIHLESTSAPLSQEINKAALTVRALDQMRLPDTANPSPFPYLIFGFQNGQSLATSGVTGTPTLTTTATLASPVGTYPIACAPGSLASDNYTFSFTDGSLAVAQVANTFSVNFYAFPGNFAEENKPNILLTPSMPAGFGDWRTSGWTNIEVPWGGGLQPAATLTSNQNSSATFLFKDCRNGWVFDGVRSTLLGDGNGHMMDGHVNSTLQTDDPGNPNKFDMEMTGIPFAKYDVIFYIGANQAQFGDGTGRIVFNGVERGFTVGAGRFNGTFTEMVNDTTPGNYIIYRNVTGSSFSTQMWGLGQNGFNHVGPYGFQVREVVESSGYGAWASANGISSDANADSNGDGVANGVAYFMNNTGRITLPTITGNTITWTNGGNLPASEYGSTKQFVLETSPNLKDWSPVLTENLTTNSDGPAGSLTYTVPSGLDSFFIRLKVMPTP